MKILLLGKDGQVGWELQRALAPLGTLVAAGRAQADLGEPERVADFIRAQAPDLIVNAAAYTAVDKAETDAHTAFRINAEAAGVIAAEAARAGAWLVHYSTDYVFDGEQSAPYTETDAVNPLSVYGRSKLEGENLIRAHCPRHLIFRTCWVHAARGGNFAKTMLRLATEREELKVVCDQFGAPTSAELIADVTALAVHRLLAQDDPAALAGTYHLAAAGTTSWHGYAQYVLEQARERGMPVRVAPDRLLPIPAADYPTPARRPRNSMLDTTRLQQAFQLQLPDWRHHVARLVAELAERGKP